jgi:hypothetical protein
VNPLRLEAGQPVLVRADQTAQHSSIPTSSLPRLDITIRGLGAQAIEASSQHARRRRPTFRLYHSHVSDADGSRSRLSRYLRYRPCQHLVGQGLPAGRSEAGSREFMFRTAGDYGAEAVHHIAFETIIDLADRPLRRRWRRDAKTIQRMAVCAGHVKVGTDVCPWARRFSRRWTVDELVNKYLTGATTIEGIDVFQVADEAVPSRCRLR